MTNSWVQYRPFVYILYSKHPDDNNYKQCDLVEAIVIRLVIDFCELIMVALKKGGCMGKEIWGLLDFVAFVCVWVCFCFVVEGACVRDWRGLGLCTVGAVG
jgi:hypothetical protein